MESFKTEKENELMLYNNYSYVILRKNNNTIRWKCSQNTTLKCPGKITTNLIKPVSFKLVIIYIIVCIVMYNIR
jgi:hypothetical protein